MPLGWGPRMAGLHDFVKIFNNVLLTARRSGNIRLDSWILHLGPSVLTPGYLTRWAHGFSPSFRHLLTSNMQWSSMVLMFSVISITTLQTPACVLFALHRISRYDSCPNYLAPLA
jgi:hypothetical protein